MCVAAEQRAKLNPDKFEKSFVLFVSSPPQFREGDDKKIKVGTRRGGGSSGFKTSLLI